MKKIRYVFVFIAILFISCFNEEEKSPKDQPIVSEPLEIVEQDVPKQINYNSTDVKNEENIEPMFFPEEKEREIETEVQILPKYQWRISTEDFKHLNLESIESFNELLDLYSAINLEEVNYVILQNLRIASFDGFERLPNVKGLHLSFCEINDFYGIYFNSLDQYNLMMINEPYIWIAGSIISTLNGMEKIDNLTSLIIQNSRLLNSDSICFPSNLRLISLTNTPQFREYLPLLPVGLEVLSLAQTDVTEEDILILQEHRSLKAIYLKNTPMMSEEFEEKLVQIKGIMNPIELIDQYIDIQ